MRGGSRWFYANANLSGKFRYKRARISFPLPRRKRFLYSVTGAEDRTLEFAERGPEDGTRER